MVTTPIKDDFTSILSKLSKLKVSDLEHFSHELNALIARKRVKKPENRIKQLYKLIDETILDKNTQIVYNLLAEKLRSEQMTDDENRLYLTIAEQEAQLRNQRISYMIELSQLRQIPFNQLMEELGLKPLSNG